MQKWPCPSSLAVDLAPALPWGALMARLGDEGADWQLLGAQRDVFSTFPTLFIVYFPFTCQFSGSFMSGSAHGWVSWPWHKTRGRSVVLGAEGEWDLPISSGQLQGWLFCCGEPGNYLALLKLCWFCLICSSFCLMCTLNRCYMGFLTRLGFFYHVQLQPGNSWRVFSFSFPH